MTNRKWKVLNCYAGLGGNRKLWKNVEVTAVEIDPEIAKVYKSLYPEDRVILSDAHEHLANNALLYDFVWSSPPCQNNSRMMLATKNWTKRYPDLSLYQQFIFLSQHLKAPFVIENVKPYYPPLIPGKVVGRHMFWTNFDFNVKDEPSPEDFINLDDKAGEAKLKAWLGIDYPGTLYYKDNHNPGQVLRNCVHPNLGLQLFQEGQRANVQAQFGRERPDI